VFVYCSYQIPTLSYSPPCACVLNTVLTVVYLAKMDPVWCGREGALPALVPSCCLSCCPPINLLDYSKVDYSNLLDYCISIVIVVNGLLIIMLLLKLLILSLIFFALSWKYPPPPPPPPPPPHPWIPSGQGSVGGAHTPVNPSLVFSGHNAVVIHNWYWWNALFTVTIYKVNT
jgi:hypothetical protein